MLVSSSATRIFIRNILLEKIHKIQCVSGATYVLLSIFICGSRPRMNKVKIPSVTSWLNQSLMPSDNGQLRVEL